MALFRNPGPGALAWPLGLPIGLGLSRAARAGCCMMNWFEHNAALRRRGSLLVWLDREMEWLAPASGRPGRPQTFSDAAIQFCLSIKVLLLWLPPVMQEVSDPAGV